MTETAARAPRARRPGLARRGRLLGHELRGLLRLAGPIVLSQLGQIGMNTADTIMVGPLGATPLAAVGLGSAIHTLFTVLSMGVLVGMTPLVSQAFGAADRLRCRAVLVQGLWVALALTLPVTWASLLGEPISLLFGQDAAVSALTGEYMAALAWGVLPLFLFLAGRNFLEGMGIVTPPMVINFLGLAINVGANAVLIYGVDGLVQPMGAVGAGWATTIVRWSMLGALALYFFAHRELRPFAGIRLRPERLLFGRILKVGGPIGAQFGLEVGLFSFAAVMMGWLGPVELAAHQVTINIAATTFMVALGTSIAGSIRVGQHIGAGRPRAVRRAIVATYTVAVGFMAVCAAAFVAVPEGLIGLYSRDAEIVRLGAQLLLVAAFFQVFDGAQVAGVSVLRGAADTRTPMLMAALGYWAFGLPVAYLLAFRTTLGPVGVWVGLSAGLAAVAVLLGVRVARSLWRTPVPRRAAASA